MTPPIKNYVQKRYPSGNITQGFGENYELYSRFGMNGHNGIDIVAPWGTDLLAVEDGIVVEVNNDPKGYGKHVRFISGINEWTYGHCSEIHVQIGDEVKAGDVIAQMGNTGFVVSGATPFWKYNPYAGTHLHLGLRKVKLSPKGWSYKGSDVKFHVVDYENGYKGSIDPSPLFLTEEEKTRVQLLTLLSLAKQARALLLKLI